METQGSRVTNPLMWIAAIAVILFCGAGFAAIMGWIPTSVGRPSDLKPLVSVQVPPAAAIAPGLSKPRAVPESRTAPVYAASAPVPARCSECGVIEGVREIEVKGEGSGLGAVGGAVVGGLLGNQVGAGHGKQVATVAGAVGGVIAGNEIEKRVKSTKDYEVTVRMDDGSSRVFHQADVPAWRAGDHVKVIDGAIRAI